MSRDFIYGMIFCVCLFSLTALTPIHNRYGNETNIYDEFQNIYFNMQPRQFRTESSTPTLTQFQDGEIIFFSSNGVSNLLFRSGQNRFTVKLSSL